MIFETQFNLAPTTIPQTPTHNLIICEIREHHHPSLLFSELEFRYQRWLLKTQKKRKKNQTFSVPNLCKDIVRPQFARLITNSQYYFSTLLKVSNDLKLPTIEHFSIPAYLWPLRNPRPPSHSKVTVHAYTSIPGSYSILFAKKEQFIDRTATCLCS